MLSPPDEATRESVVVVLCLAKYCTKCLHVHATGFLPTCYRRAALQARSWQLTLTVLGQPRGSHLTEKGGPRTLLAGWQSGKERSNFARSGVMGMVG